MLTKAWYLLLLAGVLLVCVPIEAWQWRCRAARDG